MGSNISVKLTQQKHLTRKNNSLKVSNNYMQIYVVPKVFLRATN